MFVGLGIPVQSSTQEPDVCLVVFVVGRLMHFCLHKSLSVNLIVSVLFFPLGIYCLRKRKKSKTKTTLSEWCLYNGIFTYTGNL